MLFYMEEVIIQVDNPKEPTSQLLKYFDIY